MTKPGDPAFSPDWDEWARVDRNALQRQEASTDAADPFDTTIHGPWMSTWPITHRNRHVDAHLSSGGASADWTKA